MHTILIVEDSDKIRKLIDIYLRQENYSTRLAINGTEALAYMEQEEVDLIVADIMMPGMDGFDLVKELRKRQYDVPILMATAKTEFDDKKLGFLLGADDYMTKPINLEEMAIRKNALLRRSKGSVVNQITVGDFVLDYGKQEMRSPRGAHPLPSREFRLLYKLLSTPGYIYTRQLLLDEIWGTDANTGERAVDICVSRLRDHLTGLPLEVVTVYGLGYKCILQAERGSLVDQTAR